MNLYQRLQARYPENFAGCFDFSFGEGWDELVEQLTHQIIARDPNIRIDQVKEKFGTLRYYVDRATPEVRALIDAAETASESVCERCGEPGTLRRRGWMATLCDLHAGETK